MQKYTIESKTAESLCHKHKQASCSLNRREWREQQSQGFDPQGTEKMYSLIAM